MAAENKISYLSVPLLELSAGRPFPGNVYLCIAHKMVRYRNKDDELSPDDFNRLVYNHVKFVFIDVRERTLFDKWIAAGIADENAVAQETKTANPDVSPVIEAAQDQRRAMMDIFQSAKDQPKIQAAVTSSKKLVSEIMRKPFAVANITSLQQYSKGCVDHSVNVSMLSVFLGLQMGYTHQLILENLALGGLFHDIGKTLVETKDDRLTHPDDPAMQMHPKLGAELLEQNEAISNEVRLIVAQHHEFLDGSGYPNKLKGLAVYDLARLVTIANIYDNYVSESRAKALKDRVEEALGKLEKQPEGKLDAKKLEKVIKILRYSFV